MEKGDRVQIRPHHDIWMMGDRYGTIEKVARKYIHVRLDKSGKVWKFLESDILLLWEHKYDD